MRMICFASRNTKEMVRDRINLMFGLGFPVVVLLLLTAIQANVPVDIFPLSRLTPGICVFGLSFIALFASMLISKDRSSSLVLRLFTSPMTGSDFIFGYTLPLALMSLGQIAVCLIVAFILGLRASILNNLMLVLTLVPSIVLNIAIGLICGTLLNDKQVGGVCGALLTNLSAWLSGTWFDLDMVGGAFQAIAKVFPFCHAVDAGRAALSGDWGSIFPELWPVIGWAGALLAIAIAIFTLKMKSDSNGKQ